MHPRIIPILAFLIWSVVCWRWYVCGIKGACQQDSQEVIPAVQPLEQAGPQTPKTGATEAEQPSSHPEPVRQAVEATGVAERGLEPQQVAQGVLTGWAALTAQWPEQVDEQELDRLQLVRSGEVLRAHFPPGMNSLSQVELLAPFLRELARHLSTHPDRLTIQCFTDGVGSAEENLKKSKETALLIQAYLIQQGVPSGQVVAGGLGEQRSIASNDHPQGRYCNRRVEIQLHP